MNDTNTCTWLIKREAWSERIVQTKPRPQGEHCQCFNLGYCHLRLKAYDVSLGKGTCGTWGGRSTRTLLAGQWIDHDTFKMKSFLRSFSGMLIHWTWFPLGDGRARQMWFMNPVTSNRANCCRMQPKTEHDLTLHRYMYIILYNR